LEDSGKKGNSTLSVNDFLNYFGFEGDPFESTNADNEPRLADYFVPPPYFPTVLGDARFPQSQVVLAPRGSGKTAQRRMIEGGGEGTLAGLGSGSPGYVIYQKAASLKTKDG
jgi:hypothetical protein